MTDLEKQFAELADRVRRRIKTSPKHSHTAREAAKQLAEFESPSCTFSTAVKVAALRETLRDYKRGLQFSDNILHHPGDRRPGE